MELINFIKLKIYKKNYKFLSIYKNDEIFARFRKQKIWTYKWSVRIRSFKGGSMIDTELQSKISNNLVFY